MQTLNIIGCGKLGRTLAKLWQQSEQLHIQGILNSTHQSASEAVNFIGAGTAYNNLGEMPSAAFWLIATPDAQIEPNAKLLAIHPSLNSNSIVFHCSGSLTSEVLSRALGSKTELIASIHPVHSFSSPQHSVQQFSGCHCAYEGQADALLTLQPLFTAIGAQLFPIDAQHKTHYHAASVIACNYLVALLDASLTCFEKAGVSRDQAQQLLLPLVQQTVDNTLERSPEEALTGPIARGDASTVEKQLEALSDTPTIQQLYQILGRQALDVARKKENGKLDYTPLEIILNRKL